MLTAGPAPSNVSAVRLLYFSTELTHKSAYCCGGGGGGGIQSRRARVVPRTVAPGRARSNRMCRAELAASARVQLTASREAEGTRDGRGPEDVFFLLAPSAAFGSTYECEPCFTARTQHICVRPCLADDALLRAMELALEATEACLRLDPEEALELGRRHIAECVSPSTARPTHCSYNHSSTAPRPQVQRSEAGAPLPRGCDVLVARKLADSHAARHECRLDSYRRWGVGSLWRRRGLPAAELWRQDRA